MRCGVCGTRRTHLAALGRTDQCREGVAPIGVVRDFHRPMSAHLAAAVAPLPGHSQSVCHLVLAVPATLVGSTASADRPATFPHPRFAAYSHVTPGTPCVPDDVAGVVNAIAWEEIERLGARGLPVCDVR